VFDTAFAQRLLKVEATEIFLTICDQADMMEKRPLTAWSLQAKNHVLQAISRGLADYQRSARRAQERGNIESNPIAACLRRSFLQSQVLPGVCRVQCITYRPLAGKSVWRAFSAAANMQWAHTCSDIVLVTVARVEDDRGRPTASSSEFDVEAIVTIFARTSVMAFSAPAFEIYVTIDVQQLSKKKMRLVSIRV